MRPQPVEALSDPAAPSLFDIIARIWDAAVPVDFACTLPGGGGVAFALADGNVALAGTADPEPAASRVRIAGDTGRSTITPRVGRYAPLELAELGDNRARVLLPAGSGRSFLAVRADGRLARITRRGQVVDLGTPFGRAIDAVAAPAAAPLVAIAAGRDIAIGPEDEPAAANTMTLPADVSALGFDARGATLAAATAGGIALVTEGSVAGEFAVGEARQLVFSADGRFLAAGLERGMALVEIATGRIATLGNYPAPVRALAWSRPANALATSGAYRAAVWSMATPPFDDSAEGALMAGRAGTVLVECVAAHPRRPLLAVGHADGVVTLAAIGAREEMVLLGQEGGAVTALAWTGDGDDLAIGRADGLAAVASLPPTIFK